MTVSLRKRMTSVIRGAPEYPEYPDDIVLTSHPQTHAALLKLSSIIGRRGAAAELMIVILFLND